jgi:hypothetical protein
MGAFTVVDQIWYPDVTDIDQPNVWAAHIAQSVSDGIGKRLARQELTVGLKASVDSSVYTIPYGPATLIPYSVTSGRGDFNNGFSFSAGVATCQTPGMYSVTASLGTNTAQNGAAVKVQVYKNALFIASSETTQTATVFGTAAVSCVLNCAIGDTISAKGGITAAGPSNQLNSDQTTHMSIALVQALPL